MYLPA